MVVPGLGVGGAGRLLQWLGDNHTLTIYTKITTQMLRDVTCVKTTIPRQFFRRGKYVPPDQVSAAGGACGLFQGLAFLQWFSNLREVIFITQNHFELKDSSDESRWKIYYTAAAGRVLYVVISPFSGLGGRCGGRRRAVPGTGIRMVVFKHSCSNFITQTQFQIL